MPRTILSRMTSGDSFSTVVEPILSRRIREVFFAKRFCVQPALVAVTHGIERIFVRRAVAASTRLLITFIGVVPKPGRPPFQCVPSKLEPTPSGSSW